jgi:hypothetical protein
MEGLDLMRCESSACAGEDASRRVLVSTTPGSVDGRLFWLYLCEECYEREGWQERDLASERDMWELATGSDPDAGDER